MPSSLECSADFLTNTSLKDSNHDFNSAPCPDEEIALTQEQFVFQQDSLEGKIYEL